MMRREMIETSLIFNLYSSSLSCSSFYFKVSQNQRVMKMMMMNYCCCCCCQILVQISFPHSADDAAFEILEMIYLQGSALDDSHFRFLSPPLESLISLLLQMDFSLAYFPLFNSQLLSPTSKFLPERQQQDLSSQRKPHLPQPGFLHQPLFRSLQDASHMYSPERVFICTPPLHCHVSNRA